MESIFQRLFLRGELGYQDMFMVFNETLILFSEGLPEDVGTWREVFYLDAHLVEEISGFFRHPDKDSFKPAGRFFADGSIGWHIEGKWLEGYGKVCFAMGKSQSRDEEGSMHLVDHPKSESNGNGLCYKKIKMEALISKFSTLFLNAEVTHIDGLFKEALASVGILMEADRANLFVMNHKSNSLVCAYEWRRDDQNPDSKPLKSIPLDDKKRFLEVLVEEEVTVVPSLSNWASNHSLKSAIAAGIEISSLIMVPIQAKNRFIGLFVLCSGLEDKYDADTLGGKFLFRQLGNLFGSALAYQSVESGIFRNEKLLNAAELLAKTGSWRFLNAERKIFLSQGIKKLFGLNPELDSIEIHKFLKLVRQEDKAKVESQIKLAIKTKEVVSGEFVYVHSDGNDRYIYYSIQVNVLSPQKQLEVFGYCMDITEKKAAEKNLIFESQILAQVSEPIFVTDMAFQVIYMNQAAKRVSGKGLVFRGNIAELYKSVQTNKPFTDIVQQKVEQSGHFQDELSLRDHHGEVSDYAVNISSIKNTESGSGYVFLINNLSQKREREDMAKKAKLIVEKSPAVLFTLDIRNHFQITYVTENISQFGYVAKELILEKVSFLDLIHQDDLLAYRDMFADPKRSPKTREYRVRLKNGTYMWVEDKMSEIRIEEGMICHYEGLFQDITDRKKDRAEIERIKNRYRVLASNIPQTNVFLIDENYRYLVAEGPNFDYWGLDKEYFEGKTIEEANTTNFQKILPLFKKARKTKTTVSTEFKYMNKMYQLIAKPIFSGGKLEYFLGIVRDISLEYRIQKALEKSELKYRNLVEESTELIFSINSDLEMSYVSPNIKQFLGYETFEFTSGGFRDFLHPDDDKEFMKFNSSSLMQYFEQNPKFECRMKHKDGTYRILGSSGKLIRDDEGGVRYYMGIARDITKLKETQRELFLAKNKAEMALEAKSQFLSIMSHEIRTPMSAVIGLSHLLLEDNPREDQLENLRTLQFSAENLLGLINDILDFNKIDSGKIELENVVFEPLHTLNRIVHSYAYQVREKSLEIKLDISPKLPKYIMGDPVRISQILNNLISNAIKFTRQGYVKISIFPIEETETQVFIRFEVEDTGIGVPENKLETIFEAFTQASSDTTRKFGGTGLGLAIVKKLIQLLGSEIYVESVEGKGTRFYFSLPFDRTEKIRVREKQEVKLVKDLNSTSLLVAEDNVVNQVLLRKYLAKWGVGNIQFANNGKMAVEMFMEGDFDIVLLDLQMPVMDGFEAAKKIRKSKEIKSRNVPIIALTASSFSEVKEQLLEAGMDDYVSKPFVPANLYSKITKYL